MISTLIAYLYKGVPSFYSIVVVCIYLWKLTYTCYSTVLFVDQYLEYFTTHCFVLFGIHNLCWEPAGQALAPRDQITMLENQYYIFPTTPCKMEVKLIVLFGLSVEVPVDFSNIALTYAGCELNQSTAVPPPPGAQAVPLRLKLLEPTILPQIYERHAVFYQGIIIFLINKSNVSKLIQ